MEEILELKELLLKGRGEMKNVECRMGEKIINSRILNNS